MTSSNERPVGGAAEDLPRFEPDATGLTRPPAECEACGAPCPRCLPHTASVGATAEALEALERYTKAVRNTIHAAYRRCAAIENSRMSGDEEFHQACRQGAACVKEEAAAAAALRAALAGTTEEDEDVRAERAIDAIVEEARVEFGWAEAHGGRMVSSGDLSADTLRRIIRKHLTADPAPAPGKEKE